MDELKRAIENTNTAYKMLVMARKSMIELGRKCDDASIKDLDQAIEHSLAFLLIEFNKIGRDENDK